MTDYPIEWQSVVFPKLASRLVKYTVMGEPDECWLWSGRISTGGYGNVTLPTEEFSRTGGGALRTVTASRAVIILREGRELLRSEYALHSCDNPPCCNPAHLSMGSALENMGQKMERGRGGHTRRRVRLSDAEVARMRFEYNECSADVPSLVLRFGVCYATALNIVKGRTRTGEPPKRSASYSTAKLDAIPWEAVCRAREMRSCGMWTLRDIERTTGITQHYLRKILAGEVRTEG